MAQFAPVAPIQMLEDMKKAHLLGTYHLLLAHHVLEYPERFHDLFADLKGCTIIMDNSIVELGQSENEQKVLDACNVIGFGRGNWIFPVLTDVIGDGAATREAAAKSYVWWEHSGWAGPLMVVLQGANWEDFCQTVDFFLLDGSYPNVHYVGIPRILVQNIGTRQLAIQYVDAVRPDVSVHLLGFSDNVVDDVICSNHPSVEGIDSAVPLRYSHVSSGGIFTPTAEIPPRPVNWFEEGRYDAFVEANLANIRKWVA